MVTLDVVVDRGLAIDVGAVSPQHSHVSNITTESPIKFHEEEIVVRHAPKSERTGLQHRRGRGAPRQERPGTCVEPSRRQDDLAREITGGLVDLFGHIGTRHRHRSSTGEGQQMPALDPPAIHMSTGMSGSSRSATCSSSCLISIQSIGRAGAAPSQTSGSSPLPRGPSASEALMRSPSCSSAKRCRQGDGCSGWRTVAGRRPHVAPASQPFPGSARDRRAHPRTTVDALAEVDGNRTRRMGIAHPNRFEGGGAHQVPRHLPVVRVRH